jgi:hypothetical protein
LRAANPPCNFFGINAHSYDGITAFTFQVAAINI